MATTSADSSGTAPALAGPFTLREVVVMGGALLVLIGSVLPFQVAGGSYANVWTFHTTAFNQFVTLALPLVIGVAFAWRRLAGRTKVTAGSLTLDQLASVVSLLGILYFFISSVMSMNPAFLLGLLGSLVMAGGTAAAPYIPGFVLDFAPGQEALLTRPILPSAPRAAGEAREPRGDRATRGAREAGGSAVAGASPAPVPEHTHTAAGNQTAAAASDATAASPASEAHQPVAPSLAAGLAATHSTTPEPTPGAGPHPVATEGSATDVPSQEAAQPAANVPADAPASDPVADPADARVDDHAPEADATASATQAAPVADASATDAPAPETTVSPAVGRQEAGSGQHAPEAEEHSFSATSASQEGPAHQAFWFAVPERRTALNESTGRNAFVLEPGEWILALEDRGYEFLVQDTHGSVGVLRDLGRIERA